VFYDAQGKEVIVSQEDNITASYAYWDWTPTVDAEVTLVVNTTQFNDGTSLETMTDNYWKVDTLLKTSKSANEFIVVMWNAEYPTQTEAEAAPINYSFFQNESSSTLIEVARFLVIHYYQLFLIQNFWLIMKMLGDILQVELLLIDVK